MVHFVNMCHLKHVPDVSFKLCSERVMSSVIHLGLVSISLDYDHLLSNREFPLFLGSSEAYCGTSIAFWFVVLSVAMGARSISGSRQISIVQLRNLLST